MNKKNIIIAIFSILSINETKIIYNADKFIFEKNQLKDQLKKIDTFLQDKIKSIKVKVNDFLENNHPKKIDTLLQDKIKSIKVINDFVKNNHPKKIDPFLQNKIKSIKVKVNDFLKNKK